MKKILLILILMFPAFVFSQEILWEMIEPISAQVELTSPDNLDLLLIQDVSDSNLRKSITVKNLQESFIKGGYPTDTISVSTVSPEPYKYFIVNSSAGEVNIELPFVNSGDSAWYSFTLEQNSHHCNFSVSGGSQQINGQDAISLSTEQSHILVKQNKVDGYYIIQDTRAYYRIIPVTISISLLSGYESGGLYACRPADATDITIILENWEIDHIGDRAKFVKFSGVNSSIRVLSVDNTFDEIITVDDSGFEVTATDVGYTITQDSRPGAENTTLTFFPTDDISTTDVSFFALPTVNPASNVITSSPITSIDPVLPNSLGFWLNDGKAIIGLLSTRPINAYAQIKLTSAFNRNVYIRFNYYEYDYGTFTLNPIPLATTSYSSVIDNTIFEQRIVSGVLPENTWAESALVGKVLVIELQAIKSGGGGSDPTIDFQSGSSNPSRTSIDVPSNVINHAALPGVVEAQTGVPDGHINNSLPIQFPELTTVERDALVLVNDGMKIFNTTTGVFEKYTSGDWGVSGVQTVNSISPTLGNVDINLDNLTGYSTTNTIAHAAPTLQSESALLSDVTSAISGVVNPTIGYLPYNNGSGFGDSPVYTDGNIIALGSTSIDGGLIQLNNGKIHFREDGQRQFQLGIDAGTSAFTLRDFTYDFEILRAIEGRVLIGTTTDNGVDKLQVEGSALVTSTNTNPSSILTLKPSTNIATEEGDKFGLTFSADGSNSDRTVGIFNTSLGGTNWNSSAMTFWGAGQSKTFRELMRLVDITGNFLINTTTDNGTDKLQVSGSALIGGLTNNGVLITEATTATVPLVQFTQNGTLDIASYSNNTGEVAKIDNSGKGYYTGNVYSFNSSNSGTSTLFSNSSGSGVAFDNSSNTTVWRTASYGTNYINIGNLEIRHDLDITGTATAATATLGPHLIRKEQIEDASIDGDFNSLAINGVPVGGGGFNYDVQALSGTTETLDADDGMNSTITLTGNTTIELQNLTQGMSGNITVTNAATQYTITLTDYTFIISPFLTSSVDAITMSGSSKKDVLSWYYDGTQVIINGTYDYQ